MPPVYIGIPLKYEEYLDFGVDEMTKSTTQEREREI